MTPQEASDILKKRLAGMEAGAIDCQCDWCGQWFESIPALEAHRKATMRKANTRKSKINK